MNAQLEAMIKDRNYYMTELDKAKKENAALKHSLEWVQDRLERVLTELSIDI